MKLTVQSSLFSCYRLILGQNMFLNTLFSKTISLHLSLRVHSRTNRQNYSSIIVT